MKTQFRKKFHIIPKILYFTIAKKSLSLNFRLGPFSRSWGTREDSFSVDAPGELGLSFQKRDRHKKGVERQHRPSHFLSGLIVAGVVLALFGRLFVHPWFMDCTLKGHPVITLAVLSAVFVGAYSWLWSGLPSLRGPFFIPIAAVLGWLAFKGYGWFVAASVICPA